MVNKLVIVESAAKVKTIEKFLGRDFKVMSCQGHVLDLPKSKLGVDLDNGFAPTYVSTPNQKKILTGLKKAAKGVEIIFLATDPDREGEAIAFHLAETLNGGRAQRISFNEITRDAVLAAVGAPRALDEALYAAQQARRILDRIVGYSVSPILWRKVQTGLSAGRVQSVAVRLICEREAEIEKFAANEYWTLEGVFRNVGGEEFRARLVSIDGQTLMGPGRLEKYERRLGNEAEALAEQKKLTSKSYRVTSYVEKEKRRSPGPPFTTSTMQQAAANTLGFTGKKTMAVAQSLYEGVDLGDGDRVGLITYMRTDAVRVASSAVAAARKVIAAAHGEQYLPSAPRGYKSRRGAQEAHEAIRPTDPGRTPEALKRFLTPDQNKLYNLIYRRFLASQMADALLDTVAADLEGNGYAFHASAQRVKFPGFLKVLPAQEKETFVPKLAVGDEATLVDSAAAQHFTEPPARYNDASLVRALEGYGIGRPSTYAPIVSTIIDRNYVERRGRAFFPTELGKLVNALLVASFPDVVNVKFTAEIESELDLVEEGREDWRVVLRNFYHPFAADLEKAGAVMDAVRDDAVERTDVACPKCGALMDIRWGRYGKYLRCTNYPDCQGTLNFKRGEDGQIIAVHPEDTGETCEICGAPMIVKRGRFGEFLACSKYPECKNTRRLRKKIDALCPKCGGQVVQIPGKGRGRRPFYGCTNYPKCDFTSSAEPVNEPCPQCGAHYLVKSRKGKKCAQKGCGYEG